MLKPNFRVDWNLDHRRSQKVVQGCGYQKTYERFWSTFGPLTENYFSPYSAIFATMGFERQEIQERPSWLLRDGFIPLLWFLHENTPQTFGAEILIPVEFMPYVPNNWKAQASYYQYQGVHHDKRSDIIVFLNSHPLLLSEVEFELQMTSLEKHIRQLKIKGEILLCASHVGPAVQGFEKDSYGLNQMVEFTKRFGKKVKYVDWTVVSQNLDCRHFYSYEFNNKMIIADTFQSQYVLSKGAIPLDQQLFKNKPALSVSLSLHHQINLFDQHLTKSMAAKLNERNLFYKKLASLSYAWKQPLPWPLEFNTKLSKVARQR